MKADSLEPIARPGDLLLGKYRVEKTLGEGGMGIVFAVRHTELDELFAMKVAKPATLDSPASTARFMREARAAARLRSEHVARVHDYGKLDSGVPYMLMEHLEGCDLAAHLAEHGALAPARAIDCALGILDAIEEAHGLGIVHRDLKPENVFLAQRPNGGVTVKVLDFGISKHLDVAASAPSITQATGTLGSPHYMSPEQVRSAKAVDGRTDIWSIGVILYEMLAGRLPFRGDSVVAVCTAVLDGCAPSLAEVAPRTPPALVRVVETCLARDPRDRYRGAAELREALLAIDLSESAPEAAPIPAEPAVRRTTVSTLPGPFTDTATFRPARAQSTPPVPEVETAIDRVTQRKHRVLFQIAAMAVFGAVSCAAGWLLGDRPSVNGDAARPVSAAANDVGAIFTPAFAPALAPPAVQASTEARLDDHDRVDRQASLSHDVGTDEDEDEAVGAVDMHRMRLRAVAVPRPHRVRNLGSSDDPRPKKHHYEGIY